MTNPPRSLSVTLRWPPSINGYWRSIVRGRYASQIISEDGRAFRSSVALTFKLLGQTVHFDGPVAVDIELRKNDRRRYDLDNHVKAIGDALTHAGVWNDDFQIDHLTVRRGPIVQGDACAIVTIKALEVPA